MKTLIGIPKKDFQIIKLKWEYWNSFFDYVFIRDLDGLLPFVSNTLNKIDFRPEIAGFHYSCSITIRNRIGVQLYLDGNKPEQNKARYDLIESKFKYQIDALDCKNVEWKRQDDKITSYVNVKLEADIRDKADWPRQMEWMYETLMELHKIVKPQYGAIRGI